MLFLLFKIRDERYCLDASRIIEVVPMVLFKKIPHAPLYLTGLFNYRGTIVPVVDLSALLYGEPCRQALSTRIVLVDYRGSARDSHIVGLLAEHVTETISRREEDFQSSGVEVENSRFLGGVISDDEGMVQKVEVDRIPAQAITRSSIGGSSFMGPCFP
jgi:chemotaxis-related protein WspB